MLCCEEDTEEWCRGLAGRGVRRQDKGVGWGRGGEVRGKEKGGGVWGGRGVINATLSPFLLVFSIF